MINPHGFAPVSWAAGVVALLLSVPAWAQNASSSPEARPALQLPLPLPFPLPYKHITLTPRDANEAAYLNYLRTTQVFPDQAVCTREMKQRLAGIIRPDTLKIDWVTPPFLTWSRKVGGEASVGAVEHLYAITEAHITALRLDGKEGLATFACFAKYADAKESEIWRAGHVQYGTYINAGHTKYTTGPANISLHATPGTATEWEKEIRYLK